MTHDLLRQLHVTFRSARFRIIKQRRLTMARSLRQPHVARNRSLAQLVAKVSIEFRRHLLSQVGAIIKHGKHHALDRELVGNVSLRVLDTERPDVWEVQARGELALAVLVELMRREGFELTVGNPQVVTREVDGKLCEPIERMSVDAPEEYVGVITQMLALRKGRMAQMVNHGTGWVRMEYLVPARGLIGFRTEFLTETRGTGLMHHVFDRWEPWQGELRTRPTGSLVADRPGSVAAFALFKLQERGTLSVGPGDEVYEGMIIGESTRGEDLDVNATKAKHLTNVRSSTADELVRLVPKRELSLDQALEFLRVDECVEVTPKSIRMRKKLLDAGARIKMRRRAQPG